MKKFLTPLLRQPLLPAIFTLLLLLLGVVLIVLAFLPGWWPLSTMILLVLLGGFIIFEALGTIWLRHLAVKRACDEIQKFVLAHYALEGHRDLFERPASLGKIRFLLSIIRQASNKLSSRWQHVSEGFDGLLVTYVAAFVDIHNRFQLNTAEEREALEEWMDGALLHSVRVTMMVELSVQPILEELPTRIAVRIVAKALEAGEIDGDSIPERTAVEMRAFLTLASMPEIVGRQ